MTGHDGPESLVTMDRNTQHLAASGSEANVEQAIVRVLGEDQLPTFDAVRALVRHSEPEPAPVIGPAAINLVSYDALIPSRSQHA